MTVPATCDLSDRFGDDARLLPPLFRDFGKRKLECWFASNTRAYASHRCFSAFTDTDAAHAHNIFMSVS